MNQQISEGNATGAQLYLGSAVAGTGAAIFGAVALLCSGPVGWIAAGTAALAAGLGIAGWFYESDPFEQTCQDYHFYK